MKRARRTPPSFVHQIVAQPRYSLADLLMQMPAGAPIDADWEAILAVGREAEPAVATLRTIRAMQRFLRKQQRKRASAHAVANTLNVGRATLYLAMAQNPDLPASFVGDALASMAEPRHHSIPFIPRSSQG